MELLETNSGAGLTQDLAQLYRRAVFNLLVGNRNDHLRNHGFLRLAHRLAPERGIRREPNPAKRHHALTWDGKSSAPDLAAFKESALFYRIVDPSEAQAVIDEVRARRGLHLARHGPPDATARRGDANDGKRLRRLS